MYEKVNNSLTSNDDQSDEEEVERRDPAFHFPGGRDLPRELRPCVPTQCVVSPRKAEKASFRFSPRFSDARFNPSAQCVRTSSIPANSPNAPRQKRHFAGMRPSFPFYPALKEHMRRAISARLRTCQFSGR